MGRFPSLVGRFPTLMGRFPDFVPRGRLKLLPLDNPLVLERQRFGGSTSVMLAHPDPKQQGSEVCQEPHPNDPFVLKMLRRPTP